MSAKMPDGAISLGREAAMATILRIGLVSGIFTLSFVAFLAADDPPRYQVEIKDKTPVVEEVRLPIDPVVRIQPQSSGNIFFGLTVENVRITCSPAGSVWPAALIDGAVLNPANGNMQAAMLPLPKGPGNKERVGFSANWTAAQLDFSQTVEVVPSKPVTAVPGAKRKLDTCRVSYVIENKDKAPHEVAFRANIDILINNNDGALFASPTTEPGQVLNGVTLEGKKLPHFIQVLEQPNVQNPGFAATMTLKFGGKTEGPSRVVLTQLGALGGGWDVPALAAGDSACALFWEKKTLKPGEKRELVWAYGGGLASDPESDGKVTLALGGNLEPGKRFTISALVEDPVSGQTLELQLPPGMERIEGAEIQPVPTSNTSAYGLVLWKGRVTRPGAFDIQVRSSTGVTQTKSVTVRPIVKR
jgi:hypothetical protein